MGVALVDMSVDYVTITAKTPHTCNHLLNLGYEVSYYEQSVNREVEKGAALHGYRGKSIGKLFYGEREDGIMVRASGSLANVLMVGVGTWGKLCSFPRVDIQATGKLEWDNRWYAQQAAQKARNASAGKAKGRQSIVALYDGDVRGSTCSIGSRNSARYLRLYDKTRESSTPVDSNLWRWEVEYKKPLANQIAARLIDSQGNPQYIAAQVYGEFSMKGVTPPWEANQAIEAARIGVPLSTVERNLRWLRTNVRPTIERLLAMGYTEEVMCALGLQGSGPEDNTGKYSQE
jgi:DNA relaxase NicK